MEGEGGSSEYRVALVREVSPALANCELSFLEREPIDVERARAQHRAYCELLASLGLRVVALPADPELPDSVFVEDTAVVLEEVAVVTHLGAASRRTEVIAMAEALRRYRPLAYMQGPGTVDGGDVLRIGRTLYVGTTARSTDEGHAELRALAAPYGYRVQSVAVDGCLHMKSACGAIGEGTVLVHRPWVDASAFEDVELVDVPASEAWAANAIFVNGATVVSSAFPETADMLEGRGFDVRRVDVSELHKAEGGVSCLSVLIR